MEINKSVYKDVQAVKLSGTDLEVAVLPKTGGKIASIYSKKYDYEFLVQAPEAIYRKQDYDGVYTDGECSGFDDMFPTIDRCFYEDYPWQGTVLPDHGEVWSLEWDVLNDDDILKLGVNGVRLPYRLEKDLKIEDNNKLVIDYRVTNLSTFPMSFLWAAHIMINIPEKTKIILPPSAREGAAVFTKSGRIGKYGDTFQWPEVSADSNIPPLDISRSATVKDMEKYFIKNKFENGICELEYPDGKRLTLRFSEETVPYLGILLNENGWNNNGEWNSLYNIFLEPCTSTFDRLDVARLREESILLGPKAEYSWSVEIRVGE